MIHNANKPPNSLRDVILILGPGYDEMAVGYYSAADEKWRERSIDGKYDCTTIEETEDCYVAGWTELPDVELWKDQLIGRYEWRRAHEN